MARATVLSRHAVLVAAVDLSEASKSVFDAALEVAHDTPHARIHLVHVVGARRGAPRPRLDTDDAVEALGRWAERLPAHASEIELHAIEGRDAASAIVEFAAKVNADVILVGTHGRDGVARVLQGSVAEMVVRTADRSVLVVRDKPGR